MNLNNGDKYYDKPNDEDDAENEDLNVVDDSEDNSDKSSHMLVNDAQEAREKYKKSILHRYLADSVDAMNTLKDEDKKELTNTKTNKEKKQGDNLEEIPNAAEAKYIQCTSPDRNRKRKRSASCDDIGVKYLKTENAAKNKAFATSRSLDSATCSSNSNTSSSHASCCSLRNAPEGKPILPLNSPR